MTGTSEQFGSFQGQIDPHRKSMRRFCVAHMKTPDLNAAARYMPFFESASAVTAPEHASSERVEDLDQSLREIVLISANGIDTG